MQNRFPIRCVTCKEPQEPGEARVWRYRGRWYGACGGCDEARRTESAHREQTGTDAEPLVRDPGEDAGDRWLERQLN